MNIFKEEELTRESVVANYAATASDGKTMLRSLQKRTVGNKTTERKAENKHAPFLKRQTAGTDALLKIRLNKELYNKNNTTMKTFNDLTGLYSLSKTLRFELKPVGRTLENIETKGLIAQDEQRAEEYEKVKAIIDRYHKSFIRMCLSSLHLKLQSSGSYDSLEEYENLASKAKRTEDEENAFTKVKANLRGQIVNAFKQGGSYGDLFKKELIQQHLPDFVTDEEEKVMVDNFSKFTTYFTGFHENRKNMYSDEEKSTAIAYRLIHENLPMFIDNMRVFAKVADSTVAEHFADVEFNLNVEKIADMFQLDSFSDTLTQEQIEVYNNVICGKPCEDGTKIQGLNEYINLYNQQQRDRASRLPLMKPLYKMILSDRVAIPWLPEEFTSDEQMLVAINKTYDALHDVLMGDEEDSLRNLLGNLKEYDLDKIYIANDLALTDISQHLFGQYDVFTAGIKDELRRSATPTKKERENPELYDDRINRLFKSGKSFSIAYLNSLPQPVQEDGTIKTIESYFEQLGAYDRNGEQRLNLFTQLEMAHVAAADTLAGRHAHLNQSETDIKLIKDLLDAFKDIQHFIKPLLGNGDEAEKDNDFDASLSSIWNALDMVTSLYNKVRNWLTRKPYSDEKIKLNFENKGDLLGGWVDSKTDKSDNGTQYGGYLFRKRNEIGEYDFYLGISSDKKLFRRDSTIVYQKDMYERLDYYQVKGQTIFGSSYEGNYEEDSKKLLAALNHAVVQLGMDNAFSPVEGEKVPSYLKRIRNTDQEALSRLINEEEVSTHYQTMHTHILHTLSKLYRVEAAIQLSKREDLAIEELFDAISLMPSKSFSFFPVSNESITHACEREDAPLYLFKISNKDLSFAETNAKGLRKGRGTENLHTMYFKALLSMIQGVYDIGTGEVFYRKKTEGLKQTTAMHVANTPIKNKNKDNSKEYSLFTYNITKDKRYTCDKFQFHLSIIINYDKPNKYDVNSNVHDIIRDNGVKHIIGIDRGERHLLYLSLIDLNGHIVKQMTLNDIVNEYKGNTYTTNYRDLLAAREGDRAEARRNWQKIENIKEIKEGYLSQVVHIISKMMVEYKAIVVLEDLNMGFMRGRQKIERQVYEKFEKMLIDKLNYYVDKQKDVDATGGLLHAMQLTNKFESFRKLGKQSGCLFYIPAWNTSKIDPVTGFVNLLDTRYENADKARCFFSKFDSIRYNAANDWFEFELDYTKFTEKATGTRTQWTLCTYGTRIDTFRNPAKVNQWDNKEINLTEAYKALFEEAGIDYRGNLKNAICQLTEKKYLEPLMHLMKLLLQMRNSITGSEVDYLLSPVADENGRFYDSRTADATLPKDADANGAYNIARKGLWAIRQIQTTQPDAKLNLAITNKEWLLFAQQKPYLNE